MIYHRTNNGILLKGDCLELMPKLTKQVDMILCDLPYGTTACKWDTVIPFEPLWEHYKRLIKPNGAIVLTASQPFTSALVMSNVDWFRYQWVWNKVKPSTGLHANRMPLRSHEDILVFGDRPNYFPQKTPAKKRVDKPRLANNGEAFGGKDILRQHSNNDEAYPRSILTISNADQTNRVHPTQKPVALFEYLIKTYTNEGDTVLDNCMGSGTTAVACESLNRKWIGIEREEKYCEVIKERLK